MKQRTFRHSRFRRPHFLLFDVAPDDPAVTVLGWFDASEEQYPAAAINAPAGRPIGLAGRSKLYISL
jgi:hypothetical protein